MDNSHKPDSSRRKILQASALALAPTGEVDPGSDESSHLGCKAGIHVFPFALCQERFAVPGLLSRALAGDVSYRDP